MKKPIPTKVHGALDYVTALGLLALPKLLKTDLPVSRILHGAAGLTLAYSLVTRYEWGALRVLPMRAHLAFDGASGAAFCLLPFLLTQEPKPVRAVLGFIGAFELIVTGLSQSQSPEELR